MQFSTLDFVVFIGFIVSMMAFGLWLARTEKITNSQDYFLASKTLP
ncbi:MAG: hypothetical protein NW226_10240 [Microscillaceae bacterium]|nr:hypothetical protein [Microscillaceae bacterium]